MKSHSRKQYFISSSCHPLNAPWGRKGKSAASWIPWSLLSSILPQKGGGGFSFLNWNSEFNAEFCFLGTFWNELTIRHDWVFVSDKDIRMLTRDRELASSSGAHCCGCSVLTGEWCSQGCLPRITSQSRSHVGLFLSTKKTNPALILLPKETA